MLPTGNCSRHGGGGRQGRRDERPGRTINREEFKLEVRGAGRRRRDMSKRTEGIQDNRGTFTRTKCNIDRCYLQVQQSFKFPSWAKTKKSKRGHKSVV